MSTPDLSAKLPPPHDEEPAQLRSDILDELQDHLHCAVDRERRRLELSEQPVDAVTIWQSVLERFGDPSALARRLWFDAMKGRLMTQRVLLGAVAVLAALLLVGGWKMTTTLSAVVDQNQKATAAILERMGKEVPAGTATGSPEWVPVKYRLVEESIDGPPAVGKEITLTQGGRLNHLSEVTNAEGIADFGLIPYGTCQSRVESSSRILHETIVVRPGRPIDMRIVVPETQKTARVKFEYTAPDWKDWGWREGQSHEGLEPCLLIQYRTAENDPPVDGRKWFNSLSSGFVLVRADGMYKSGGFTGGVPGTISGDTENRIESVEMAATAMVINADWYYPQDGGVPRPYQESVDGAAPAMHAAPNSQSGFFNPIHNLLTPEFVAESRKKAEQLTEKMPLTIPIEAGTEPMLIRLPLNHPALIDSVEMSGVGFGFGGGGGGGFF